MLLEQPEQLGGDALGERLGPAAPDHEAEGRLETEAAAEHVVQAGEVRHAPVVVVAEPQGGWVAIQ